MWVRQNLPFNSYFPKVFTPIGYIMQPRLFACVGPAKRLYRNDRLQFPTPFWEIQGNGIQVSLMEHPEPKNRGALILCSLRYSERILKSCILLPYKLMLEKLLSSDNLLPARRLLAVVLFFDMSLGMQPVNRFLHLVTKRFP
ncbi:CD2 antigen cytoplasmic tail-binding protein 2 [Platysternon megacephalum]|uniref:CD2 antigen cytoplasmic tail-binding protein 2 n=1 Tax=Platysternon megacephalum TaxID=55544 RepID=A0A4D9DSB1_9SAUR|nr:CD2 antigen cytoplasmic tail-binding protein 2 [Platysternon megacephalum]